MSTQSFRVIKGPVRKIKGKWLYKVTTGTGMGVYARAHAYSLPALVDGQWVPGKWQHCRAKSLEMCARGFHVTTAPVWILSPYLKEYRRLFIAEVIGVEAYEQDMGKKYLCRSMRLLKEVKIVWPK